MSAEKGILGIGIFWLLFWIYTGICWVVNLVQLISCDFEGPWKEEIIHIIEVLISPASGVTVWL